MCSYKEVIAKSNGTSLEKHSLDTLNIITILLDNDEKFLKYKFDLLNLDFNIFKNNLMKVALFHDFGKAYDIWQKLALDTNYKGKLPPHAPYSGFFMEFTNNHDAIPLLVASSHHSLLTNNSFKKNLNPNISFNETYLEKLAAKKKYKLNKFHSIVFYFKRMQKYIKYTHTVRSLFPKSNSPIDIFFKLEYCLSLLYLTMADGLSSYFEDNNKSIDKNYIVNKFPSISNIYNNIYFSRYDNFTDIQNAIFNLSEKELSYPLLVEAPCGEGKTLASLLFAKKLFEKKKDKKSNFCITYSNNLK